MILVFIGIGVLFGSFVLMIYGVVLLCGEHKHTRKILNEQKQWSKAVDKVVSSILK